MNDSGLVDVVIPVFNGEKTIIRAINSVLNQDSKFINNIIVVDDGSTDSSFSVVQNLNNNNIKLIKTKNCGVASARNLGISKSDAIWIAFLDADDIWEPYKIKKQLEIADFYDLNFVCGAVNSLQSYESHKIDAAKLMRGNIVATSTVLVKRGTLLKHSPIFKPGISFAEDYLAWLKCLSLESGYYLGVVLATYTFDPLLRPRYKRAEILINLLILNIEYLKFLIKLKISFIKKVYLQIYLLIGTLKSIFSIFKRYT
jgi:glycosyltransferase involved in cell wall biosynthesis